ncbi:MAG: hypothetical protein ACFB21_05430 [Opitutales bacterium]
MKLSGTARFFLALFGTGWAAASPNTLGQAEHPVGGFDSPYFPADLDQDAQISEEEYDAFVNAWLSHLAWPIDYEGTGLNGEPIPIDYVSRAAYLLWEFDGHYELSTGHEGARDFEGSTDYDSIGVEGVVIGPLPYEPALMSIARNEPPESWVALAVEERVPSHYVVQDPTRDPVFNIYGGWEPLDQMSVCHCGDEYVIRWAPVPADNHDEHLYQIVIPLTELPLSNADFPSDAELTGTQSYDGGSRPTLGRTRAEGSAFDPMSWLDYFMAGELGDVASARPNDPLRALREWLVEGVPRFRAWTFQDGGQTVQAEGYLHRAAVTNGLVDLSLIASETLEGPYQRAFQLPEDQWPDEVRRRIIPRRRFVRSDMPPDFVRTSYLVQFVDPAFCFFRVELEVNDELEAAWLQIVNDLTSD